MMQLTVLGKSCSGTSQPRPANALTIQHVMTHAPGTHAPGTHAPGMHAPGTHAPGMHALAAHVAQRCMPNNAMLGYMASQQANQR